MGLMTLWNGLLSYRTFLKTGILGDPPAFEDKEYRRVSLCLDFGMILPLLIHAPHKASQRHR